METILVTGGAGFLGAHVAKRLVEKGNNVVVFDLQKPDPSSEIGRLLYGDYYYISFIKGNIMDIWSIIHAVKSHRITKIVHTAVVNDLETLKNNPLLTMKINVEGTINILEVARLFDIKKVVLTSSISVYTPKKYEPMDERHPILSPEEGPTLLSYSSSKLAAEAFGLHYWSSYKLDVIFLRLSAIYGFGMKYPMFVKPIVENSVQKKDTHFEWGKNSKRDYTYINDVVKAIELALKVSTKNRIFNIATGENLRSAEEVAEIVKTIEPTVTITFGKGRDEIEEATVASRGKISIDSARKELGFNPDYSLEKGVKEYFEIYKDFLLNS